MHTLSLPEQAPERPRLVQTTSPRGRKRRQSLMAADIAALEAMGWIVSAVGRQPRQATITKIRHTAAGVSFSVTVRHEGATHDLLVEVDEDGELDLVSVPDADDGGIVAILRVCAACLEADGYAAAAHAVTEFAGEVLDLIADQEEDERAEERALLAGV